ncbi:MAG: ABC transporter substrate-binding protein [Candidatus Paceibacterota bacterium]
MSKNSKIIWGAVAIIVIVLVVWNVQNKSTGPKEVIKIGVVVPLTGGASGYGEPLVKGLELAMQDLGDTKYDYKLVIEDDGTNPATSASAAQKLVNIDKVRAIITTTSGTGNAVKPIATAAGVPHTCICVDSTLTKDNRTNFIYLALPEIESRAWVDEAATVGMKKVALIAQNHPGFNLIVNVIKPIFAEKSISVVFEERYDPSTKDFKTVLAKARASNPDGYFIGGFPPSLEALGREIRTLDLEGVAGFGTFALAADLSIFEGNWFTDVRLADSAFQTRFEQAFPKIRFNARTAPEAYDVFNILVDAFESGQNVSEYMRAMTSYAGKSGNVTKEADSGNFSVPVGIWTIKDGKAVQVK